MVRSLKILPSSSAPEKNYPSSLVLEDLMSLLPDFLSLWWDLLHSLGDLLMSLEDLLSSQD